MIDFEKLKEFIDKTWVLNLAIALKSERSKVLEATDNEWLEEVVALKQLYNSFLFYFEKNLIGMNKEGVGPYFHEVFALFVLPQKWLDNINALHLEFFLAHGVDYQSVALNQLKEVLRRLPGTDEETQRASALLMIVTGGATRYTAALAEVERQARLAGVNRRPEPIDQSTINQIVAKYVKPIESIAQMTNGSYSKLSIREIVLMHIYESKGLTRAIANHVAAKAGYNSATSGQQLMNDYNRLANHPHNRLGVEGKALTDMIKNISRVIPNLSKEARERAEKELQTLQAKK